MCFKNLPIEFDANGHATLKKDAVDPYSYEEWTGGGQSQRFPTDPVGNPLSPYHPWNKETIPAGGAQQESALATLDYDLLVVGPRRPCSVRDLLPWSRGATAAD